MPKIKPKKRTHLYLEQWGQECLYNSRTGLLCCLGHDALDRGVQVRPVGGDAIGDVMPGDTPSSGPWNNPAPHDLWDKVEELVVEAATRCPDRTLGEAAALVNDAAPVGTPEAEPYIALLREIFREAGRPLVVHRKGKRVIPPELIRE